MLSGRMLHILEYLQKHPKTTYKDIVSALEIKERYIRYDIDKINDYLCLCQLPVIEKKSKGVIIFPDNIDISLLNNEEHFFYSANERLSLLLLILLFDAKHLKLNKLSEDFQVSRSTIKKDMSDLEKKFMDKGFIIQYTDHFEFHGNPNDIMNLRVYELSQYIFLLKNQDIKKNSYQTYAYNLILKYLKKIPLKDLFQWIDKILENTDKINDEGYQFFAANIILLVYYLFENIPLPPIIGFDAPIQLEKYNEVILTFEDVIQHEIKHYYRGTLIRLLEYLDNQEGLYDCLHFTKIEMTITELVKKMSEYIDIEFKNDVILLDSLAHHIPPLLKRIHTNRVMYHNSKVIIPKEDYYIYEALEKSIKEIDTLDQINNSDEIIYLAVHFIVSMNRLKQSTYKRIIIVCNYGYGTSTMLKEVLLNEFQVKVVDVLPQYKLSSFESFDNIDYIISTLPLKNTYGKNNVVVNPLLTPQDYTKLKKAGLTKKKTNFNYNVIVNKLDFLKEKDRQKVIEIIQNELGYTETKLKKQIYKVSDLLKKECIQIIDQDIDWKQSIYDSARLLEKNSFVIDGYGEEIVSEIEKIGFYSVTDGLFALFHGRNNKNVYKSGMSLIVNKQAVIFDNKQVNVVFCLASKDKKDQIPAMVLLMRMIKKTDFLKQIENATKTDEVLTILKECEKEVL